MRSVDCPSPRYEAPARLWPDNSIEIVREAIGARLEATEPLPVDDCPEITRVLNQIAEAFGESRAP